MPHALIVDDNLIVSRAIRDRLHSAGFASCDYAWSERQAFEAADKRIPDLIVVGDTVAGGSPVRIAQKLARSIAAPVMMVVTDEFMRRKFAGAASGVDGPYLLRELENAVGTLQIGRRPSSPASSVASLRSDPIGG